jgi:hypothetical protein
VIGEMHILGLYAPAALVSAIVGGLLILLLRQGLLRIGFYQRVWHPGLFDLALFIVLWAAAAGVIDHLHSNRLVLSW